MKTAAEISGSLVAAVYICDPDYQPKRLRCKNTEGIRGAGWLQTHTAAATLKEKKKKSKNNQIKTEVLLCFLFGFRELLSTNFQSLKEKELSTLESLSLLESRAASINQSPSSASWI